MDHSISKEKRRILAGLAGGFAGATQIPGQWIKPVINTVILPTHAQTSPTTTAPPTTTRCLDNSLTCLIDRQRVSYEEVLIDPNNPRGGFNYIWSIPVAVTAASNCGADFTGAGITVTGQMYIYGEITDVSDTLTLGATGSANGVIIVNTGTQNPFRQYSLSLTFAFQDTALFGDGTVTCGAAVGG